MLKCDCFFFSEYINRTTKNHQRNIYKNISIEHQRTVSEICTIVHKQNHKDLSANCLQEYIKNSQRNIYIRLYPQNIKNKQRNIYKIISVESQRIRRNIYNIM
ncbi:uncharacterized protein LOC109602950 [Aethina tumida]|uniref:uncharacterized protein LOC109602950 n=1 Tax=Aethina tumida TaxID=116153 RepID=UPI002149498C|nr:uncharacterized protein LOC109602950 [Aethina tumida]